MNIIIYGFAIIGFSVVSILVYDVIGSHLRSKKDKKEQAGLEAKLITKDCGCVYNPDGKNFWQQCDQHHYEDFISDLAVEFLQNEKAVLDYVRAKKGDK